jgi:hypothetical protein
MCNLPSSSVAGVPRCRFQQQGDHVWLIPKGTSPSKGIRMPKVPSSLIGWLMLTADAFFDDHQRCLAFLLLFDPQSGHWLQELPRQTCRHDGVSWTLSREGLAPLADGYILVGSFQSHPEGVTALAAIPRVSGLHFVHHPASGDGKLQAVFHYDQPDRSDLLDATRIIASDHDHFLRIHQPRLQLV